MKVHQLFKKPASAQELLKSASENESLSTTLIIGYEGDSEHIYFAATESTGADLIWLLEQVKLLILQSSGDIYAQAKE